MGSKKRAISHDFRLVARSTADIAAALGRIVNDVGAGRAVTFLGRKVGNEAVLNALVLWLDARSPAEQAAWATEWVGRLEAHVRGDDAAPADAEAGPADGTIDERTTAEIHVDRITGPARPARRERAG